MRFPVGEVSDSTSSSGIGVEVRQQRLLCRHFCDTLPNFISVYRRERGTTTEKRMKRRVE